MQPALADVQRDQQELSSRPTRRKEEDMNCNPYGGGNCGSTPTTVVQHIVPIVHHAASTGLPFTGGDVLGLTFIGIGAIAAGVSLLRRRATA
jgi:hypothetical protein